MLKKIISAKYWMLIATALFLSACANTGVKPDVVTPPPAKPIVKKVETPVIAKPVEKVTTVPLMKDLNTQSSLDAVANGALVYFAYDRYDLSAEAQTLLKAQVAWLQAHSSVVITVEGNCDERGTREYNLALGDRRANSVKNYMVALGLDPARIRTISYGKERPLVTGAGESVWAKNRRSYTRIN